VNRPMLTRMFVGAVVIAAIAGAGFTGRAGMPPAATPREHPVFSRIRLSGSLAPQRVSLAPLSVERLGVSTATVTAEADGSADVRIPLTALIYDPQGLAWTYVVVGPDAYERVALKVDHIYGDYVLLAGGPRIGAPVVAVGAPELLGVEYGVGEE
jgi:hypothetical protein